MYLYHEVILLVQMSLWQLMYLQDLDIRYCRCSFLDRCIYKALIFIVADALFGINVSATCFSSNLQILLSLPVMYNCIYILSFLGFKDTSFANLASTSHVFDNVRMLPSKIPHPQPILSIPCRYSPVKLCILNLLFQCFEDAPIKILHLQSPKIHYRRYRRSISFEFYLLHNLSQYITYKKIDIRNSSEYGVSVGDT